MTMNVEQQSQLKLLIAKGKEQGYLTYREVNDHLPNDIVDPAQIEDIVGMINDMGIVVHEVAPDLDSIMLTESNVTADDDVAAEEAAAALATVDSEFGRTTDPVRMYMREMGTVELLTREDEIAIAKRIEDGIDQVYSALARYPGTIVDLLDAYQRVENQEVRLAEVISGFRSEEDDVIATPIMPRDRDDLDVRMADPDDEDSDENEEDGDGVVAGEDEGPDPEIAKKHFDELKAQYTKYLARVEKHSRDDKSKTIYDEVAKLFLDLKLVPKVADNLVKNLRDLVDRVREHERVIMDICVSKAGMPRKVFISTFPDNETDLSWLQRQIDSGVECSAVLRENADEILRV